MGHRLISCLARAWLASDAHCDALLGHELAQNLLEKWLMTDIDARLRDDVHLLGELLGNTIRDQECVAMGVAGKPCAR